MQRWVPWSPSYANATWAGLLRATGATCNATTGCCRACRNNHVWLDAATGKHPLARDAAPTAPVCIACDSAYLSANATAAVYSVWNLLGGNASGAPAGSPAAGMGGLRG